MSDGEGDDRNPREQDRFLPIANISRIMKKVLPNNAKIAKESKETVQECVSEFISFITSEASDKCQREKRKTINGDDLLWAMSTLGFEDYVEPLRVYLHKYREAEKALGKQPIMGGGQPGTQGQALSAGEVTSSLPTTGHPMPGMPHAMPHGMPYPHGMIPGGLPMAMPHAPMPNATDT